MRVKTLESMNNLNMMLTIHLEDIAILTEQINNNLLTLKIKTIVWLSQIARMKKI